ncbi:LamG domain-containing protein [Hyunsoonleella flava]|uniref:LamG domain-containing protein n=1 Tax=Hyunsoonleella flava TaxID=2527939 RepID=A0A4Q9FLB8_9FLAO|nr:LamG domain-containing protein [Hyunsoonleella flava]TBN06370.1 LamG domain-containing protein [Hyunsoonleella flava]
MKTTFFKPLAFMLLLVFSCSNNDDSNTQEVVDDSPFPSEGLLAYYLFNNSADDSSSNEYHADDSNVIYEEDRNGVQNSAAAFNGFNAVIAFPNEVRFKPMQSSTLSFWIRTGMQSRYDLFDQRVGSSSSDNHNHGIIMNASEYGNMQYVYPNYNPNNGTGINETIPVRDAWTHFVYVKDTDTNTIKIYVNSVEVYSGAFTDQDFEVNGTLLLGVNYNESYRFEGYIDDIFIYNRALNTADINKLFKYIYE